EHSRKYVDTLLGECEKEKFEAYVATVSVWIIFNEPIENEKTIFDLYYARKKRKITHARTKKVFSTWVDLKPAIYEIISIDDRDISKITVQDVESNKTY